MSATDTRLPSTVGAQVRVLLALPEEARLRPTQAFARLWERDRQGAYFLLNELVAPPSECSHRHAAQLAAALFEVAR